jgi:hypothetical protein
LTQRISQISSSSVCDVSDDLAGGGCDVKSIDQLLDSSEVIFADKYIIYNTMIFGKDYIIYYEKYFFLCIRLVIVGFMLLLWLLRMIGIGVIFRVRSA